MGRVQSENDACFEINLIQKIFLGLIFVQKYLVEIDKENFEDAIKAFFIIGKLGGFNSLNLQAFFAGEIELSYFNYKNDEVNRKMPSCFHELGFIEVIEINM